jgi:hypothetical protein
MKPIKPIPQKPKAAPKARQSEMTAAQERVLKDLEFANKPKYRKNAQGVTVVRKLRGFEKAAPYQDKQLAAQRKVDFLDPRRTPEARQIEARAQALRGMLNQRRKLGGQ